jgi:hypothetical protein
MNGLAGMITGSGQVEGLSGQIGLRETGACPRVAGPLALACWSMQVVLEIQMEKKLGNSAFNSSSLSHVASSSVW